MARIVTGTANCRDLVCARQPAAQPLPELRSRRRRAACARCSACCWTNWTTFPTCETHCRSAIVDEPPVYRARGRHDPRRLQRRAGPAARHHVRRQGDAGRASRPRRSEKTGIKNLRVGYNRVFGYYIEVSKGQIGPGAGDLHPQADAHQRRTLYHPGAQGAGEHDPDGKGPHHRAGIRAVLTGAPASGRPVRPHPAHGARRGRSWTC